MSPTKVSLTLHIITCTFTHLIASLKSIRLERNIICSKAFLVGGGGGYIWISFLLHGIQFVQVTKWGWPDTKNSRKKTWQSLFNI